MLITVALSLISPCRPDPFMQKTLSPGPAGNAAGAATAGRLFGGPDLVATMNGPQAPLNSKAG